MSHEESMRKLEEKLVGKLDDIKDVTSETDTAVKLLSQAFENKDKASAKFEAKTEKNEAEIFSRLRILEEDYAAGSTDRETMADARSAFVKWMVISLCGLVVTFGGGIALLMTQISKLG